MAATARYSLLQFIKRLHTCGVLRLTYGCCYKILSMAIHQMFSYIQFIKMEILRSSIEMIETLLRKDTQYGSSSIDLRRITRNNLGIVRVGHFWKCYGSEASKS
jgi:hypothetical protein